MTIDKITITKDGTLTAEGKKRTTLSKVFKFRVKFIISEGGALKLKARTHKNLLI